MVCTEVANRYAQALFNISSTTAQMKQREELLALFSQEIPQGFFINPHIKIQIKKQVLKLIEDRCFVSFLILLIQRSRFKYLPQILKKYAQLIRKYKGQLEATFITAQDVHEQLQSTLKEHLRKVFGKSIILHTQLQPQIIGGAILLIENQMLDLSVKGRLDRLKTNLTRNFYEIKT